MKNAACLSQRARSGTSHAAADSSAMQNAQANATVESPDTRPASL